MRSIKLTNHHKRALGRIISADFPTSTLLKDLTDRLAEVWNQGLPECLQDLASHELYSKALLKFSYSVSIRVEGRALCTVSCNLVYNPKLLKLSVPPAYGGYMHLPDEDRRSVDEFFNLAIQRSESLRNLANEYYSYSSALSKAKSSLSNLLSSCSTTKQLLDQAPELTKYVLQAIPEVNTPEQRANTTQISVPAHSLLDNLRAIGWEPPKIPKTQPASA